MSSNTALSRANDLTYDKIASLVTSSKSQKLKSEFLVGRKSEKDIFSNFGTWAWMLDPTVAKCLLNDSGFLHSFPVLSYDILGLIFDANLIVFQIPLRSFLTLLALRSFNTLQSNLDLPCPDLPGTPIYRNHFLSPYTVHLQVFSVKPNPDLPGSPIYRGNFLFPTTPVNQGLTVCGVRISFLFAAGQRFNIFRFAVC